MQKASILAARADFECESVLIAIDTVEEQDLGVRKNRLRMARGSCHRFPSLKHLMVKLFGSIQATTLHQNRGRALIWPSSALCFGPPD